jgi:molecular chaperone HscA
MKMRALREQQVEADRLVEAIRAALAADGDLLSAGERHQIEAQVERLTAARAGDEVNAIHAALDALARGTETFAARRMDRAVARALTGRKLDDVKL